MVDVSHGRVLDYVPRLDPRNLRYTVAEHLPTTFGVRAAASSLWNRSRWWQAGPVLDQGQEGSCVGHGVVGEYLASPVRGKVKGSTPAGRAESGHLLAVDVYNRAKQIDEYEGVDYEGTSVRAGMLVARERHWCRSFAWARSMDELRIALEAGPVVIGFRVMTGVFDPDEHGLISFTGVEEGWHCVVVTGYSPRYGSFGRRLRIRQSWGRQHGANGNVYADPDELRANLFDVGGECAVALDRALG